MEVDPERSRMNRRRAWIRVPGIRVALAANAARSAASASAIPSSMFVVK